MNCEHKELEKKKVQFSSGVAEWYECKSCHQKFNVEEVKAL